MTSSSRLRALNKKYSLYEDAVQSPDHDVPWLASIYRDVFGSEARKLREDFCGTFWLATEWVKQHPGNTALGLDLDPEPLALGRERHLKRLSAAARKRVKILRRNVLSVTKPTSDLIIAWNFSFFIFKQRVELVRYLRCCYESLGRNGMVVFELAGGPGMIQKIKESKGLYTSSGKRRATYVWDQKSFNPITREGLYAIHFKFPDGRWMRDAFTYDWRVWTIPEIRDAMLDAGFQEHRVYWEHVDKKRKKTEYLPTEKANNEWSWVSYIAGIKR